MAADLWQMALLPVTLRINSEREKSLEKYHIQKKKSLSAGYPELQTAWSWNSTLRKYCYFLVLFFLHFLGTGYQPLMETGHCKDGSFVWPSIAILMFLHSWKDPYFNSLSSGITMPSPMSTAFLCLKPSWQSSPPTSLTQPWPSQPLFHSSGICSCSEEQVTLGYPLLWQVLGIRL